MRIVGGIYGGRRLASPKGRQTRPTSERVREAVFSILGPLDGLDVLDLFAGTGALGIEALSRGAESVTFVERDRKTLELVRANVEQLGEQAVARTTFVCADAVSFARRHSHKPGDAQRGGLPLLSPAELKSATSPGDPHFDHDASFDLVFIDPPYAQAARFAELIGPELPRLTPGDGRIVVEMARKETSSWPLADIDHRTYGDTQVLIGTPAAI